MVAAPAKDLIRAYPGFESGITTKRAGQRRARPGWMIAGWLEFDLDWDPAGICRAARPGARSARPSSDTASDRRHRTLRAELLRAEARLARRARRPVLDRLLRPGYGASDQPGQDEAVLDTGRPVVDRQHERARVERLLDRRALLPLGGALVPGRLGLVVEHLVDRVDDLVLDVVDHVPADTRRPFRRLDEDVHRAVGVAAGGLADDAGEDLVGPGQLDVEQAQGSRCVQAVDVV